MHICNDIQDHLTLHNLESYQMSSECVSYAVKENRIYVHVFKKQDNYRESLHTTVEQINTDTKNLTTLIYSLVVISGKNYKYFNAILIAIFHCSVLSPSW